VPSLGVPAARPETTARVVEETSFGAVCLHKKWRRGAEAGYPPLLTPLAPVYEGNWWELISGHEGTFTNPESLNLALRDTEVEVDSISVEASGKVVITLQREDKLAGFSINRRDRREWPHYCKEIIRLLSEKNRRMANVLSGAWLPDPR
jgi:hypothetical protein